MQYFDLTSYWRVNGPPIDDRRWHLELPSWLQDTLKLWDSAAVTDWNPELFAFSAIEGPLVDLPCVWEPFQVMSPALQIALEEICQGAIQFLPIRIRNSIGENIISGYAIPNYRHRLNCIDRKRTTLFTKEQRFRMIDPLGNYAVERLVLDAKKCTERVFKVRGWSSVHVYREDVVQELDRRGLTGLHFTPIPT